MLHLDEVDEVQWVFLHVVEVLDEDEVIILPLVEQQQKLVYENCEIIDELEDIEVLDDDEFDEYEVVVEIQIEVIDEHD